MGVCPPRNERFEEEMTADADLRAEVELQRETHVAIEFGGVSRMLKEVGRNRPVRYVAFYHWHELPG